LRLNRLTDDGCRLLLEGLQDNVTLTDLNISANGAANQVTIAQSCCYNQASASLDNRSTQYKACQLLASCIRDPDRSLTVVDISSNEFTSEHVDIFRISLQTNKIMTTFDIRRNPGYSESKLT